MRQPKTNPLVIIANGPTCQNVDFKLLDHFHTLTLNRPGPLWPTTYYLTLDQDVVMKYRVQLAKYEGTMILGDTCAFLGKEWIKTRGTPRKGFSLFEPHYIGHSSAYFSLQWALAQGYTKIIVVGVDQGADNTGSLYAKGQKCHINEQARLAKFQIEADAFKRLPSELYHHFLFVSDYNKWPWFKRVHHCDSKGLQKALDEFISR